LTFIADVELALGMELTLNLGWVVLAVCMLFVWLRMAPRKSRERRAQFVALAVVILILLPAISMTDDLVAAQNPAEIDCWARRDDHGSNPHLAVPVTASLPAPVFTAVPLAFARAGVPSRHFVTSVRRPALASIQNRPPPAA
jgi:hypothetical protein